MNTCYDRHDPKYKIKYKPSRPGSLSSVWLVCEKCFGKSEFFGSINEIASIVSLESSQEIKFKIEHISLMTEKIGEKILISLRIHRHKNFPLTQSINIIYIWRIRASRSCLRN